MFTYVIVKMGIVIAEAKYVSEKTIFVTPAEGWSFQEADEVGFLKVAVKEATFNQAHILCKPRLNIHTRLVLRTRGAVLAGTWYEDVSVWRVTR